MVGFTCWNWEESRAPNDSELFISTNPSRRGALKDQLSGLGAISCSSVLINGNSYTQGRGINKSNADWCLFFLGKRQIWENLQLLAGIGQRGNVQGIIVHPKTSAGQGWQ